MLSQRPVYNLHGRGVLVLLQQPAASERLAHIGAGRGQSLHGRRVGNCEAIANAPVCGVVDTCTCLTPVNGQRRPTTGIKYYKFSE
jgi:hypothetical protein